MCLVLPSDVTSPIRLIAMKLSCTAARNFTDPLAHPGFGRGFLRHGGYEADARVGLGSIIFSTDLLWDGLAR
jgi:hypothetical protein